MRKTYPAALYLAARKARGSQEAIAEKLHINQTTLSRRETGKSIIDHEAWSALEQLPLLAAEAFEGLQAPGAEQPRKFTTRRPGYSPPAAEPEESETAPPPIRPTDFTDLMYVDLCAGFSVEIARQRQKLRDSGQSVPEVAR